MSAVVQHGQVHDFRKIPVLQFVPQSQSSAPSSPVAGQFWFDTSLTPARLKIYENGAWALATNTGVELTANKGVAGGYASLDGSALVPIAQIPLGATASTVAVGNDARLSDQRTPTDNTVTGGATGAGVKLQQRTIQAINIALATITDAEVAAANKDGVVGLASLRTIGTGAQQALAGNTRLDQLQLPTASVNFNSQKGINGLDPTNPQDFATKNYVDLVSQGFAGAKNPVRLITTANVNLAAPGATLDSLTMVSGDRFLASAQTTTTQNGIYVWNGAAVPATRASDDDAAGEVKDGTTVAIAEGTAQGRIYIQNATPSGAPGSWTETWTWYASAITYTASNGVLLTGANFTAVKDTVDATNPINISANGIGFNTNPIDHGGTGATTAAGARTNLGVAGKYTVTLGAITAGVEFTITHNLNSTAILEPSFRVASDGSFIDFGVRVIDANSIGVTAAETWAPSAIIATVLG